MSYPQKRLRTSGPPRNNQEDPKPNSDGNSVTKMVSGTPSTSPYIPMFETFRAELDEHQDRRERVIKASRDVTALSKKMIFSLQRARALPSPLPERITTENQPRLEQIRSLVSALAPADLAGINAWRYQRQISMGIQELMEALVFERYLEQQTLLSWEEAQGLLPEGVMLTEEDWLLGVFDAVGEMMRFGVTGMALLGRMPGGVPGAGEGVQKEGGEEEEMGVDSGGDAEGKGRERDILADMRELRTLLECLEVRNSGMNNSVGKKMDVMKSCVDKIESAVYSMTVRGSERPKGWVPDDREVKMEAVESY